MNWLSWAPVEIRAADFAPLSRLWPWLIMLVFICVHVQVYKFVHRRIAKWIDDEMFLMLPMPLWTHVILMWPSFAITTLLVWLTFLF